MLAGLRSTKRIGHSEEVPITDHLEELRNRIIISLIALAVAFVVSFWQHQWIIRFLNSPLPADLPEPMVLNVAEPFMIALKVSVAGAVILTLPLLIYQIYAYVMPAFDPDHRQRTWPYLTGASLLFFVGLAFGYFLMLPAALSFLINYDSDLYNRQIQAGSYYTFVVWILLGSGIIFQLPSGTFLLSTVGLMKASWMRKNRRFAIFILAVIAAALPGGDPVSMLIALAALLGLYEVSIYVALFVERGKARAAAEEEEDPDSDSDSEPDSESDPDPGPESDSEPDPDPDPDSESDPDLGPDPDPESDPESDSDPDSDPDPESDSDPDSDPDPEPDPDPESDPDPGPVPDPESDLEPDPKPAENV